MYERTLRAKPRWILSLAPYLPIKANEDGTGGGIRVRFSMGGGESQFIDIVWGERTEIEVVVPDV